VFCLQQHKGCEANNLTFPVKYPTEIVMLPFQMSLIHYLAFESTLPPTDALISLGGCRSLLFSLYLDTKIPLVYESQIYRAFMGGNIRTECPVVLRPLRSAMRSEQYFTEFALAHFYKDASWTWCTDSGMPPQESRGICSPTQRDFVSL